MKSKINKRCLLKGIKDNYIKIIIGIIVLSLIIIIITVIKTEPEILSGDNPNENQLVINDNTTYITESGTYSLTGDIDNVIIDTEGDVELILDGVNIESANTSAIYVENANLVTIVLVDGTVNVLSDSIYNGDEMNGVIYSKSDLVIEGDGTLNITAEYNDAIVSKDSLVVNSGTYNIESNFDAFYGKDSIDINGGIYNIVTGKGAEAAPYVEAENPMAGDNNNAMGGQVPGGRENGDFDPSMMNTDVSNMDRPINNSEDNVGDRPTPPEMDEEDFAPEMTPPDRTDGEMPDVMPENKSDVVEEDTESIKGFKSQGIITINSGTFNLDTYDDAIHSDSDVVINGGIFEIKSGDDGIHAEDDVIINDGTINIEYCYEGIEGYRITIEDGILDIVANDDAMNATTGIAETGAPVHTSYEDIDMDTDPYILINGGKITVDSKGDGLDANGGIIINGGTILASSMESGPDSSFDFDKSLYINGGEVYATSTAELAYSPNDTSNQLFIFYEFDEAVSKGDVITILDEEDEVLIEITAGKSYEVITFSSSELKENTTYTIKKNSEYFEVSI